MACGGVVYDELPDASSIVVDCETTAKTLDIEVNGWPEKRATLKSRVSFSNGMHDLFICSVCSSSIYPPIVQCPNGHTLCSKCKPKVNNQCPTCRHELGNIRCLALERIAVSLEFFCRYQALGCQEMAGYYEKLKHEHRCRFRPYNCPCAGSDCSATGDIMSLVAHLTDDHKVDMHMASIFNHRYVKANPLEVESATWMLTVFNCFGKYFCLHFEAFQLGTAPVYMAFLRFMGEEDEAGGFGYSLEVGRSGRRQVWQGIPRSIRDGHRRVRESLDGLVIPRGLALFFSGGDHRELKLRVMGRIWKEH